MIPEYEQMMKCDMCYDRTSVGKKPMCATVCPSQALSYVKPEEIAQPARRAGKLVCIRQSAREDTSKYDGAARNRRRVY